MTWIMSRWMKIALVAVVLAIPITAYAYQRLSTDTCPATAGCPCDGGHGR